MSLPNPLNASTLIRNGAAILVTSHYLVNENLAWQRQCRLDCWSSRSFVAIGEKGEDENGRGRQWVGE